MCAMVCIAGDWQIALASFLDHKLNFFFYLYPQFSHVHAFLWHLGEMIYPRIIFYFTVDTFMSPLQDAK